MCMRFECAYVGVKMNMKIQNEATRIVKGAMKLVSI